MFLNEKYLLDVYFAGTSRRNLELCHRSPHFKQRERKALISAQYTSFDIAKYLDMSMLACDFNRLQIGKDLLINYIIILGVIGLEHFYAISTCFKINGKIKVHLGFIQS